MLAVLASMTDARADQTQVSAPVGNPNQTVSASAHLDFVINMGKFVFFRVGTGAYPTASATIDSVSFTLQPSIPASAATPVVGNNQNVSWNGTAPSFGTSATTVLPVEVRSNAGTISLTATASTLLTSGANTIPFSQVLVSSSDTANLPAPSIPNSGVGPVVTVVGTSFANLVTQRAANWTFSYSGSGAPAAGTYTGQITFTAMSP